MNGSYEDILELPHPEPQGRPRMKPEERAAQFSPFAALTGFEDVLSETRRVTDEERPLSEDEFAALDETFAELAARLQKGAVSCRITMFLPDERKAGGRFERRTGILRRINETERLLHFRDGTAIPMDAVTACEILG